MPDIGVPSHNATLCMLGFLCPRHVCRCRSAAVVTYLLTYAAGRGLGEEPPEPASIERLSCSRHAIQPCNMDATCMWPSKCRRAHQLPVVYAQRLPPSCCQCTSRAAISCAVSGPRRTLARCEQHIDETVLARRAVLESNDEGRFGQLASTRARLVRFGIGLDDG